MESLRELVEYIQPTQRDDVILMGLSNILGLTANTDYVLELLGLDDLVFVLFKLSQDKRIDIKKQVLPILINLSGCESGAQKILHLTKGSKPVFDLTSVATDNIIDENSELADSWCMILNNLTRYTCLVQHIINDLKLEEDKCLALSESFCNAKYNKKGQHLDYIASIFCNITQTAEGRDLFCCNLFCLFDKFVPHITSISKVRRRGVIGLLRNICFEDKYHEFIFDDEFNALPSLLYMLCGPEKYNKDELVKIHPRLHSLPANKKREEDPALRVMILEVLLQLCANRLSRIELRENGVYEILREYHKWELEEGNDNICLTTCEKVVDVLIKTEDEIGVDNYRNIEIPNDLCEKFSKADEI